MALKSIPLIIAILSFLFVSAAEVASGRGSLVGGWQQIKDLKDPEVVKMAKFAVEQHNKEASTNLSFVDVVNGYSQVVSGIKYRLVLSAVDGGAGAGDPGNYTAVVWSKPWQNSAKLLSQIRATHVWMSAGSADRLIGIPTGRIPGIVQVPKIGGCLSSGGGGSSRGRGAPPPVRRPSAQPSLVRKLSVAEHSDGGAENAKMKVLFKAKPKTPADLVRQTRDLLILADGGVLDTKESKRDDKMMELGKLIRELKQVLYGDSESEPVPEACTQLTQEFFRENTLRLLIICLPKLNLETRKDATQVVANLQRQQVQSRLIACDYLEKNMDLMDILISGYENNELALHYGAMLRECIRHQSVARHKSTVAEFLSKNYDWFFADYNSKLLESANYITRRQAVKLLGDILLDRSNSAVMTRYVCSRENLRILMNLLRESSKSIQIEAFHVFKLFAAYQNKPPDIVSILIANRNKLLRLFADFKTEKEDEQFEADKAQVVKEIAALEPKERA
ncbi:Mo25 family protein [Striga asiatica]|uniref:Mo25 family protein n=1 Tax=Striga asiatica TaxID=4170 RepID=A0A5A7QHZ9_STRAF|nr:Mo25 family protein [Striga asiatica]